LITAFEQLDLNYNGYITSDELVQSSTYLGHQLNQDEANSIEHAISITGNSLMIDLKDGGSCVEVVSIRSERLCKWRCLLGTKLKRDRKRLTII
jgi:hypothetical protein